MPTKRILQSIPVGPPPDLNAIMLLPFTGTVNSSTITNIGALASAVTATGATIQTPLSPSVVGSTAISFSGNGQFLIATPNAGLAPGTGDFTYEVWAYLTSYGSGGVGSYAGTFWDTRTDLVYSDGLNFMTLNDGRVVVFGTTSNILVSTSSLTLNAWHHVAFVRDSGTLKIYLDGTLSGSTTCTINMAGQGISFGTGCDTAATSGTYATFIKLIGYLNDFRYSDIARYSGSSFPVPTGPFPPG